MSNGNTLESQNNLAEKINIGEKYKEGPFSMAHVGNWGPEIRNNHPDQLNSAILARIGHIARRLTNYLPPYQDAYKLDQKLVADLASSFDKLAQLYLEITKEDFYGGYFIPERENKEYSWETIQAFDEKMEEIHDLIINSEYPLSDSVLGKTMVDKEGKPTKFSGHEIKVLSEEEKIIKHNQGEEMLRKALTNIENLINTVRLRETMTYEKV